MRTSEKSFHFGAEIIKSEQDSNGDWIFEGIASLPGTDLQGDETVPNGLEIDYLLGKGLPPGSGGFINYDHQPDTIVGVPLEGKITPQGFWLKWKALKTPLMKKIVEQMQAMKEAGWPRRYGMSIEGVVKQRDPQNPSRITRAFIRNVALTPTPVHPGTFVDFAKSLAVGANVEFRPSNQRLVAVRRWADDVTRISTGQTLIKSHNPYFRPDGSFKLDADVDYFKDVHGLSETESLWCARYALSRQPLIQKSIVANLENLQGRSRGHPHDVIRQHLADFKSEHPDCPHISDGRIKGGMREASAHFRGCEKRKGQEVNAILALLRGSGLLLKEE